RNVGKFGFTMSFEFATATRIIFGEGTLRQVVPAAMPWGRRALLVTGRTTERANQMLAHLEADGAKGFTFAVEGEPTVELVARGLHKARQRQCDLVIAMGGGSVIDTGKAIAATLTNSGDVMHY